MKIATPTLVHLAPRDIGQLTEDQRPRPHWLRHTTLTWVERNFELAVAHAYAGHTDGRGDTDTVTMT